MRAPCVMVSSTFYDLRQVRADIERFLSHDLGYRALLSEHHSFPVDPDATTVQNCRRRVEENADVLLLVIGGRYGSVDEPSDRSVTNLEYLTARSKGIPVYAFIEKRVLALLPLYDANPSGDFSKAVDNPKVFEFIRAMRDKERIWTFEFETAQDIIRTLRFQFAYLFQESLQVWFRLRHTGLHDVLAGLSGKAFSLALEKPKAWEYRLFSQVLQDEISSCRELRLSYQNGYALGQGETLTVSCVGNWGRARMAELRRLAHVVDRAINVDLQAAFGPPGQPGSVQEILSTARLVGEAYREALEWSLRVRRADGDGALREVVDAMASFPDDLINKVESLGDPLSNRIEEALLRASHDNSVTIDAGISINLSNLDAYTAALKKVEDEVASGLSDEGWPT